MTAPGSVHSDSLPDPSSPNGSAGPVQPDADLVASLRAAGLLPAGEPGHFDALTGGVSSDIWKVQTRERTFCVKRALSRLKVAAHWEAPLERNRFEVAWYRIVHRIAPGSVPDIIHQDPEAMWFAMAYLDPARFRLWKSVLREGEVNPDDAVQVGHRLALIHDLTASDESVRAQFPENGIFHAIRLAPYLEATAQRHPDLQDVLFALSRRTGRQRLAMIHGDVSPKNILLGPQGPVFLDAECACLGDPAFDLAFCLNHLLLKCLWRPSAREALLAGFDGLVQAYLAGVHWEAVDDLEQRAATLLPGLLLARVDGKSPVEYIEHDWQRAHVRTCARRLLRQPPTTLAAVRGAWHDELRTGS